MLKPAQFLSSLVLSLSVPCLTAICLTLAGCGSSDEFDFTGTWDGNFTALENSCPFGANETPGPLFPMLVNRDSAGAFVVSAANGDVATGGQGVGETISFTAESDKFGNFASTAPYTCTASPFLVGYLEQGDRTAKVNVYVTYTNCVQAGESSGNVGCSVLYSGDATKR